MKIEKIAEIITISGFAIMAGTMLGLAGYVFIVHTTLAEKIIAIPVGLFSISLMITGSRTDG